MRLDDYPPQEPLSEAARAYQDEVMRRGAAVVGLEFPYGEDAYQRVLICRGDRPNGTLLACLHGGGWTNGYKEWLAFMAPAFTGAGFTFASIGYRLAPGHLFPVGLEDARTAVTMLAESAVELGFDRERIFLGGHSAGGHYAALLAVTMPRGVLRGCLPISGVYDFGRLSGLPMRPRFLGAEGSGNEGAASPIERIAAKPPPFLLAHGGADFPHLMVQAERMERALREAGGEVERLVLAGRTHFSASYAGGEPDGPWVPRAIQWMNGQ